MATPTKSAPGSEAVTAVKAKNARGPKLRAAGSKPGAPVTKAAQVEAKQRENRGVGRRAGYISEDTAMPETPFAKRLAETRLRLGLTQAQAASRVKTLLQRPTPAQIERAKESPNQDLIQCENGRVMVRKPMTRSGYAMYETDDTEPTLDRAVEIAQGLGVDPLWLAYGFDVSSQGSIIELNGSGKFVKAPHKTFSMDLAWVPRGAAMYYAEEFLDGVSPGEAVIVDPDQDIEPTPSTYLIAINGQVKIAMAHTAKNGERVRVYGKSQDEFTDFEKADLSIGGKYLGRVCQA